MAEVTWIKGTIDPPQSGEYYVTLEAKQDMIDPMTGKVYYKTGDIVIDCDFYYAEDRFWEQPGKGNPFWAVVCWADILKPNIPDGVRERLVEYFGTKVKWQNGQWCVEEGKNNADAWEECRASDCPCDHDHDLPSKHSIFAFTALKYAKKIHEAGYAPVKWIDVNDRLPEESTNTPVNIVWKNTNPEPYYENIKNKPFVGTAYYYNGKWWWFSNVCEDYLREYGESDIDFMDDGIVVTHWMPIPAPPEVEQGSK